MGYKSLLRIPEDETGRLEYISQSQLTKLGYPVVNVEITKEQLLNQVRNTMDQYATENPKLGVTVVDTNIEYDPYGIYLDKDKLERHVTSIREIYREDDNFAKWNMVYKQFFLSGNLTKLVQTMTYQDNQKKVLKFTPEFTYLERENKIQFFRKFDKDCKVLIFFFFRPDLVDIPESDFSWVNKYALQELKIILGRIRGKVSQVKSSTGTVELDGDKLLSEGMQEAEQLLSRMEERRSHLIMPITIQ